MITADLILPALDVTCKKQAFQDIAAEACTMLGCDAADIVDALLERERIGSTGIGFGTAIPHIKVEKIDRLYSIIAVLEEPVDYDAIDGNPVDIIFMLIAPAESKTTQHLKSLALASRFLKDEETRQALRGAQTPEDVIKLIADWSREQAA